MCYNHMHDSDSIELIYIIRADNGIFKHDAGRK